MQYALLIYERPEDFEAMNSQANMAEIMAPWAAYSKALAEAGVIRGGAGLEAPHTATTVRVGGGDDAVQDGPFADTKELLGGFYIIDVPTLDEALQWAARIPVPAGRHIEVRAVMATPDNA
jgi:hypothetical protein